MGCSTDSTQQDATADHRTLLTNLNAQSLGRDSGKAILYCGSHLDSAVSMNQPSRQGGKCQSRKKASTSRSYRAPPNTGHVIQNIYEDSTSRADLSQRPDSQHSSHNLHSSKRSSTPTKIHSQMKYGRVNTNLSGLFSKAIPLGMFIGRREWRD